MKNSHRGEVEVNKMSSKEHFREPTSTREM
jgi:hypothetical protein